MKGLGRGAYLALVYAFLYLPIAVLIAVFQERVVGGLTQGGLKG